MPEKSAAQKLLVRPGSRVAVVNGPPEAAALLGQLPEGASTTSDSATADTVIVFVQNRAELGREWPAVAAVVRPDAALWVAYPKKGASIPTDLSRDAGWEPVIADGFDAVSLVAIDATWSAIRFRRDPALRAARAARGRPGPGH